MIKKGLLLIFTVILVFACGGNDDEENIDTGGVTNGTDTTNVSYDRGAMLEHIADDIIIPALEAFQDDIDDLNVTTTAFTDSPTSETLASVQASYVQAYKTWQYVEMFNIGKAEEIIYSSLLNIYPTSAENIEDNISTGTYDLTHPNNFASQGLPALDYLLYGVANDNDAIVNVFSSNDNAANYKQYLLDVVSRISTLTDTVVDDWNTSFKDSFVASTDNTATSSFNLLVNDFVFYYEKGFRANKFGIPAGVFSTDPLPDNVESLYNKGLSKELALIALQAIEDFFNGKSYDSDVEELGLKAYLEALDNTELSTTILNQIALGRAKINELDDSLYQQIIDDKTLVLQTFDELQKVVPYLKSDMLSAFSISVDYVDADGD